METKAKYVLIGGFTLAVLIGAFAFVLWMAKVEIDREYAYYDILFGDKVSGLSLGGDVRFNGVRIGRVTEIKLEPEKPNLVRVRIEVDADLPVRTNSVAMLNYQGLTGVSFVEISGGTPNSPPLKPGEGEEIAVIPSTKSELQKVVSGAPELIEQGIALVAELTLLLGQENRQALGNILINVEKLTGRVADQSDLLGDLIGNLNMVSSDLALASAQIINVAEQVENLMVTAERALGTADRTLTTAGQTLNTAGKIMKDELAMLLTEAKGSAKSIASLADELNRLVSGARPGLVEFSGEGLLQFNRFIADARQLVANIDRVAQRLESDPARFLLGKQTPEYKPQ